MSFYTIANKHHISKLSNININIHSSTACKLSNINLNTHSATFLHCQFIIYIYFYIKKPPPFYRQWLLVGNRRRPTLPGCYRPSTIGAEGLNFCVRYENRWIPFAIATGNLLEFMCSLACFCLLASLSSTCVAFAYIASAYLPYNAYGRVIYLTFAVALG